MGDEAVSTILQSLRTANTHNTHHNTNDQHLHNSNKSIIRNQNDIHEPLTSRDQPVKIETSIQSNINNLNNNNDINRTSSYMRSPYTSYSSTMNNIDSNTSITPNESPIIEPVLNTNNSSPSVLSTTTSNTYITSPNNISTAPSQQHNPLTSHKRVHNGLSCHQCKNIKPITQLAFCNHLFNKRTKRELRACQKKLCTACLQKFYNEYLTDVQENKSWICMLYIINCSSYYVILMLDVY